MGSSVSQQKNQYYDELPPPHDHHPSNPTTPTTTTTNTTTKESASDVIKNDNLGCKIMDQKKSSNSKTELPAQKTKEGTRPFEAEAAHVLSKNGSNITKIKEKKAEPNNSKEAALIPHNYEYIIQEADMNMNHTDLTKSLHSGIFLNQKKQKYWIDSLGHNCFMLYPRNLNITWAEDNRYWHWSSMKESSTSDDVVIEVAELKAVCWLEIHGNLDISKLSPGVKYEVVFIVMLKDPAYGWEVPVNLKLIIPHGKTQQQQHKEDLQSKPRSEWIELEVGEFKTPLLSDDKQEKQIEFSLFEYEGGNWKRGLVIKGVVVRPKKN